MLWFGVAGRTLLLLPLVGHENVYAGVGNYTKWTQTLAILEVFHILLGNPPSSPILPGIYNQLDP